MNLRKIINPWVGTEGYNCFVCSPDNPIGLHQEFYEDGDYIVTKFKPNHNYESWQNILHGGIQALLIDETAGAHGSRIAIICRGPLPLVARGCETFSRVSPGFLFEKS